MQTILQYSIGFWLTNQRPSVSLDFPKWDHLTIMVIWPFSVRPICIGDSVVECVKSYKLLGVYIDNDLKWNSHIDYIVKKSSKKLYSLRLLKRSVVEPENILKVYLSTIRPVLEYAIPIWQSIPDYLSDRVESIQRRALRIIYPEAESYD